jgi:hypothetical protein
MKPFSELTLPELLIELLRWICVLPAAVVVDTAAQLVINAAVQFASQGGPSVVGDSMFAYSLRLLLYTAERTFDVPQYATSARRPL